MKAVIRWLRAHTWAIALPVLFVGFAVLALWLYFDNQADDRRELERFATAAQRDDRKICQGQNDVRAAVAALALTLTAQSANGAMPPQIRIPPNADEALVDVVNQINALLAAGNPQAVEEAVAEQLAPIDCG